MSVAIELYCKIGMSGSEERRLVERALHRGGSLDFRETDGISKTATALAFLFDDWSEAKQAAEELIGLGEHVEGPMEY